MGSYVLSSDIVIFALTKGQRSKRQLYNSLRWPIYIFNLVDLTKLPCYPHRRSTTVSLETFTLYDLQDCRVGIEGFKCAVNFLLELPN